MLTPEQKAALDEELDAFLAGHGYGTRAYRDAQKRQRERPRVVVANGEVIRDAEVQVSERDPNWREGPRPGYVTINLEAAERQWRAERAQAMADAAHRRDLDPYNLGLWGPMR